METASVDFFSVNSKKIPKFSSLKQKCRERHFDLPDYNLPNAVNDVIMSDRIIQLQILVTQML